MKAGAEIIRAGEFHGCAEQAELCRSFDPEKRTYLGRGDTADKININIDSTVPIKAARKMLDDAPFICFQPQGLRGKLFLSARTHSLALGYPCLGNRQPF